MPIYSQCVVLRVAVLTPPLWCESLTTILRLYHAKDENVKNGYHILTVVVTTVSASKPANTTNAIVNSLPSLLVPSRSGIPSPLAHFSNRHVRTTLRCTVHGSCWEVSSVQPTLPSLWNSTPCRFSMMDRSGFLQTLHLHHACPTSSSRFALKILIDIPSTATPPSPTLYRSSALHLLNPSFCPLAVAIAIFFWVTSFYMENSLANPTF